MTLKRLKIMSQVVFILKTYENWKKKKKGETNEVQKHWIQEQFDVFKVTFGNF